MVLKIVRAFISTLCQKDVDKKKEEKKKKKKEDHCNRPIWIQYEIDSNMFTLTTLASG